MDRKAPPTLAVLGTKPADPADDRRHVVGPLASGDVGTQVDQRMPAGIALAVPRAAPADGDLELDHRLQPVDIRPFEQTRLDQSHSPGRIASRHGHDTR